MDENDAWENWIRKESKKKKERKKHEEKKTKVREREEKNGVELAVPLRWHHNTIQ